MLNYLYVSIVICHMLNLRDYVTCPIEKLYYIILKIPICILMISVVLFCIYGLVCTACVLIRTHLVTLNFFTIIIYFYFV